MEWAKNSNELILEYLNRLQNTNQVLLADAQTGAVRTLFEDKDAAWVDYVRSLDWVERRQRAGVAERARRLASRLCDFAS